MSRVLVTGGSGFIGSYCVLHLLDAGHEVRATIRNKAREGEVRALLGKAGAEPGDRLSFFQADLERDEGWADAVSGCEYVLHVASPFPERIPKDENELIRPAREGALRVLRASAKAGVKRVVLTSSFAAVGYGHRGPLSHVFDESSWTNPDGDDVRPYVKSKTLAERAAWEFVERGGQGMELATVNPVGVFGPVLGRDYSTSILVVQRLLDGQVPGLPKLTFGAVDVRDVADLHLRAMTHPAANGQRFLAVAGDFMTVKQMALLLKTKLGDAAKRVPTREIPNFIVRLAAIFDPAVKQVLPELGKPKNATSEKAWRLLGWSPRTNEEAVLATAESLIRLGLLKDSPRPS